MNWLQALKAWNASRGGYTIPRKGTPEHAEVKAMMMSGGSKASGYVKLLYAKNVNKKKVGDYDPAAVADLRPKKSAKTFDPRKIGKPSNVMKEQLEELAPKDEAKAAAKALSNGAPKPAAEPPAPTMLDKFLKPKPAVDTIELVPEEPIRRFTTSAMDTTRRYVQTAAEKQAERDAARRKMEKSARRKIENYSDLTKVERNSMFFELEELNMPIPPKMKKAYDNWVKSKRPSGETAKGRAPNTAYDKLQRRGSKKGGAKPKRYSAADAAKDKKALGVKATGKKPPIKESGQISMMMRIGNHVMVAEPQPATIKVKGDLSQLKTEFDEPTSGLAMGFEREKPTSAAQASRSFSKEETRVKPLSELFMTKPQKGLVEEQLTGKGLSRHFRTYQLQEF